MSVLTAQVLENEPILRAVAATPANTAIADSVVAFAKTLGRDESNLRKTLTKLEETGLLTVASRSPVRASLTDASRAALEALDRANGVALTGGVAEVPLDRIDRDPVLNPRTHFDQDELQALADSIADKGVAQPILLRQGEHPLEGRYRLVAGERRYRASLLAGKTSIPAVVRELDDAQALEIALIENIQRVDLSPIEEARAFRKIIDAKQAQDPRLSQRAAAAAIVDATRKSLRYVEQRLQLLTLSKADQDRMALPADNPRHLKLTDARMAMQQHDRLQAEAADVDLTPEQVLMLGELTVFVGGGKAKPGTKDVGGGAKDEEAKLKVLSRKGLIYSYSDWQTGFQRVQVVDKGARVAKLRISKLENDAPPALAAFAREALPPAAYDAWIDSGKRFVTPWLNDPIELHPSVARQKAEEAKRDKERKAAAEQRQREEEQRARETADTKALNEGRGRVFLDGIRALEAAWIEGSAEDPGGQLAKLFADLGRPGPFTAALHQGLPAVADANGVVIFTGGAALEGVRRATAIALNLAIGAPPSSGPGLGDEWDKSVAPPAPLPIPTEAEFLDLIVAEFRVNVPTVSDEVAMRDARRALERYLLDAGQDGGPTTFEEVVDETWTGEVAAEIADGWLEDFELGDDDAHFDDSDEALLFGDGAAAPLGILETADVNAEAVEDAEAAE